MDGLPVLVEIVAWVSPPVKDYLVDLSGLSGLACVCKSFGKAVSVVGREHAAKILHCHPRDIRTQWTTMLRRRAFFFEEDQDEVGEQFMVWMDVYEMSSVISEDQQVYGSMKLEGSDRTFEGSIAFGTQATPNGADKFGLAVDEAVVQIKAIDAKGHSKLLFQWACCDDDDFVLNDPYLDCNVATDDGTLFLRLFHPHARHRISHITVRLQLTDQTWCHQQQQPTKVSVDSGSSSRSSSCTTKNLKVHLPSTLAFRYSDVVDRRRRRKRTKKLIRPLHPGTKISLLFEARRRRGRTFSSGRNTPPPSLPILQRLGFSESSL